MPPIMSTKKCFQNRAARVFVYGLRKSKSKLSRLKQLNNLNFTFQNANVVGVFKLVMLFIRIEIQAVLDKYYEPIGNIFLKKRQKKNFRNICFGESK